MCCGVCSEVLHSRPENIREFAAGNNHIYCDSALAVIVDRTYCGTMYSLSTDR